MTDNVNLSRANHYIDGAGQWVLIGSTTASNTVATNTINFDTATAQNGSHYLLSQAFDAAGNNSYTMLPVTVNNVPLGQLQWMRDIKSISKAIPSAIVTDSSNNVVSVGNFSGTVDLGNGSAQSVGLYNTFVAKYTPQNVLLWAKTINGDYSTVWTYAVATDSQNNIILTGYFEGTVDFGGVSFTSQGAGDGFVAKYSPSGSLLWAKQIAGYGNESGKAVVVNGSGDVFVSAYFSSPIDLGTGLVLTNNNYSYDIVLAKLSGLDGTTMWARTFGSSSYDDPNGLATDKYGNVVVTGVAYGDINLGGGIVGSGKIFVAKYSGANGQYMWSKVFNSQGTFDAGKAVAADPVTGNLFLTGGFTGSVDFGGGLLTTLNNGNGGIFLAAYDPNGNYLWAKGLGASGDSGNAICVDNSGNLAVTGTSTASIGLDFGTAGRLFGNGYFVASYTTTGNYRWAIHPSQSGGTGASYDSLGHLLITGYFQQTVDFGGISATALGVPDGFVVQYTK